MGLTLKFDTHGNEKQKECCRAWLDDAVTDIVFGGAKGGCFARGTLVKTLDGYTHIDKISAGNYVLSFNEAQYKCEYKKVLEVFTFKDISPVKMITFIMSNNIKIKCTTNHEFYFEGVWQSASGLARRAMDIHTKNKQSVSDINKWEVIYHQPQEQQQAWYHEAGQKQKRIFGYHYSNRHRKQKCKNAQVGCDSFHTESTESSAGESFGFRPIEQLRGKSGMGERENKHDIFSKSGKIGRIQKRMQTKESGNRIKEPSIKIDRRTSEGDTLKIHTKKIHKRNAGKRIRCGSIDNKGCNFKALEAREIRLQDIKAITFEYCYESVYDLCVDQNKNYVVTENNVIVHNSKSYTGCKLIFGDALIYPETYYFIARNRLSDLMRFTVPSINEVFQDWNISLTQYAKFNGQYNYYELYNKARVYLLDAAYMPSDPLYMRFGSMQFTRGWGEETGEWAEAAKNNLQASIGRWKNDVYNLVPKFLQTCNPSKNYLYRDYYKPWKSGTLETWKKFIQALPTDNKMLPDGYIEQLDRTLTRSEKQRLLYGNWEFDSDPATLIDYDKACDVFTNTHVPSGRKCITSDIARLGGDRIVIIEWDGFRGKVSAYKREKLNVTTTNIEAARIRHGVGKSDVIVDSDGMGSGVEDFGGFKGFVNNARPMPDPKKPRDANGKPVLENFDNLKSQCGFRIAEIINSNGLYLECPDELKPLIIEELEQVKQKALDSDMKKGLVPKEKVKEALGRSPDFWDAILMRVFFELKPKFVPTADAV